MYVFVCGQRRSLAAAISQNRYIATKVVPGSLDSFDIFDFVAEKVVCSGPILGPGDSEIDSLASADESFPFRAEYSRA